MSNFPNSLDNDATLPRVDNNITEIGGLAINALRSAMFAVESNIGVNAQGAQQSIAVRLNQSLDPYGNILPSAFAGAGLVYLPITNTQISATAGIQESKLALTYSTLYLYNLYTTLNGAINVLNGFLSLTGIKVEPHIDGTDYNHLLSAIFVDPLSQYVKTNPSTFQSIGTNVINRNTTNLDTLLEDINTDLVSHEKSDGTANVSAASGGTVPPLNYAHNAAGIYVNPDSFSTIPQSDQDLQSIVEYIDSSSLLLLGSRTQNLYSNGISRYSRSTSLTNDGYGQAIVPPTPCTAYLLNVPPGPQASSPVDDFNHGDDVVLFNPTTTQLGTFNFDAQFAQVQPGDLLTINYGTGVAYQFVIDSKKAVISGVNRTYAVRINGKNPVSDGYASARIDASVFNRNKFAVLSTGVAPNVIGAYESLIITNPKAALALGNGFDPSQFDPTHYNLYLVLLCNGDLSNIYALPAIDVTGNQGITPGAYTIDTIVDAINTAFRQPGYNYRFIAFEYEGNIGIALADSYNDVSFSIISGTVDSNGNYTINSLLSYPNNVVDNFNNIDPMGFGSGTANIASPPPVASFTSVLAAAISPPLIFTPLKRNYFYVDGVERDSLNSDPLRLYNIEDGYGDGYWPASIYVVNVLPGRVEVVYQVNLDLSESNIAIGKTLVVQPVAQNDIIINNANYGRFIISAISFNNCGMTDAYANITVYDAVHGTGISPYATLPATSLVNLYFSDDSVTFDAENVWDANTSGPYKRFFEVYVNSGGHTSTHERARFLVSGADISLINFYNVSPKFGGYPTTNNDREIRLTISSFTESTGAFTGFLARWNPSTLTTTNLGPIISGKQGEITRFYDETNVDYIDFIFNISDTLPTWSTAKTIDIQLFPSLQLDQQFYFLSTCQVNDTTKSVSQLEDARQFGNVSEEILSDSAIEFIGTGARYLGQNGVVRGFGLVSQTGNTLDFTGGIALVNGSFLAINPFNVEIPFAQETYLSVVYTQINWAVCINKNSEAVILPLTDFSASLNTPNAPTRIVTLFDPNTLQTYPVDSSTFSNIINNRKDLTVIFTVVSTVA